MEQVWIKSAPAPNAAVARIRPDVHSVEIDEQQVTVRSAGISLAYLGPLEVSSLPRSDVREFVFKIPRKPSPEQGRHAHVPLDYVGVFVNGVPIPNHFEAASYQGQNLWHYDLVARGDDGSLTATGVKQATLTHAATPGLLNKLATNQATNSPILGFALDGYPIYGPWAAGKRVRSSYQLRKITTRDRWPDGTLLAPGQAGPPVAPDYPLGAFVEDYEYAPGSGDLDQYNGKVTAGTYAYFLSTNDQGRLTFPYLLAHEFQGRYTASPSPATVTNFQTGHPAILRFKAVRHLEHVHERPGVFDARLNLEALGLAFDDVFSDCVVGVRLTPGIAQHNSRKAIRGSFDSWDDSRSRSGEDLPVRPRVRNRLPAPAVLSRSSRRRPSTRFVHWRFERGLWQQRRLARQIQSPACV